MQLPARLVIPPFVHRLSDLWRLVDDVGPGRNHPKATADKTDTGRVSVDGR